MRVEGALNTRRSFLNLLINPFLSAPDDEGYNLKSVLRTTQAISHMLQEADIFQSVEAKIEKSRNLLSREGDVDVIFKTREKGRFFINTATELGNGEGNAVSQPCLVFMRCQKLIPLEL